jgi:signal transduction histidine kinase
MSTDSDDLAVLISDVRHDANNSLMAILGYLELVLKRDDLPEAVALKLRLIETEAYKIRDQLARTSFIRRPGT